MDHTGQYHPSMHTNIYVDAQAVVQAIARDRRTRTSLSGLRHRQRISTSTQFAAAPAQRPCLLDEKGKAAMHGDPPSNEVMRMGTPSQKAAFKEACLRDPDLLAHARAHDAARTSKWLATLRSMRRGVGSGADTRRTRSCTAARMTPWRSSPSASSPEALFKNLHRLKKEFGIQNLQTYIPSSTSVYL